MKKNTENDKKLAKAQPLTPAAARREIAALEKFLEDGDLTVKQFWQLKQDVLDRMGVGHD